MPFFYSCDKQKTEYFMFGMSSAYRFLRSANDEKFAGEYLICSDKHALKTCFKLV